MQIRSNLPKCILFLFLSIFFLSCTEKEKAIYAINEAELLVSKDSTIQDNHLKKLLYSYLDYIQNYPDDSKTPIFIYKIAVLYYRMGQWKVCIQHLQYILDKYQNSNVYPEAIALAASAYEGPRFNNEKKAMELYKMYREKFPKGASSQMVNFYFQPDDNKYKFYISQLQDKLFSDETQQSGIQLLAAKELIQLYKLYVLKFPNADLAPSYCFEGGKLASTIGDYALSSEFWLQIIEQYHDFSLYPETLILLAVEFENNLPMYIQNHWEIINQRHNFPLLTKKFQLDKTQWLLEAKKLYEIYLEKYPNHAMNQQAIASLKNLGKDPNEIVEEFNTKMKNEK